MLCYVTKRGRPQIWTLGDDNVSNFEVAAIQRRRKTYCINLKYCYAGIKTWKEILLLKSLSTCSFSRYRVVLATQWGILMIDAQLQ
jgi:hypothetical protein